MEELRELQEELTTIRRLLAESGFKWFEDVCKQQAENRLSEIILVPPEGVDDMVKRAYAIGECAGLKLAVRLPEIHKEQLEYDIKQLTKEPE